MAQLFKRRANAIANSIVVGGILLFVGVSGAMYAFGRSDFWTRVAEPLSQPVPFSHQHHVGDLGIDCRYCHTSVENSAYAGIPPTETCMTCHSQIWKDAPVLQPVRASFQTATPLRWTRVYDLPDYVYFNHSIHINKGVGCNTCHGPVDRMPLMYNEASLQMEWCLECHRAPEKNLRPRDQVFNMRYEQPTSGKPVVVDGKEYTDQLSLGTDLVKKYKLRSITDITSCSTCHR